MTTETIDNGIRLWFSRKGISALEDIREIERLGGTLTRGLLVVLYALPRRAKERRAQRPRNPRDANITKPEKVRVYQAFDPESANEIKSLVNKRVEERESKYAASLANLPPEPLYSLETRQPPTAPISSPDTPRDKSSSPDPSDSQEAQQASTTPGMESDMALQHFTDFVQLDKDNSESTAKIRHLLEQCRAKAFSIENADSAAEATEADLEPEVEDLGKVITIYNSIRRGIFLSEKATRRGAVRKGQTTGKSRMDYGCKDWSKELENLAHKEYHYTVACGVSYQRVVRIHMCPIIFPAETDVGEGDVFVKVELSPPGQQHPDCYATLVTLDDPANRLALRVRIKDREGKEKIYYERSLRYKPMCRANAFVDVLHGVPTNVIAMTLTLEK